MAEFKDNVVVITGASLGIGAELGLQLARQGARLVLAARHQERLEEVANRCRVLGADAFAVPTDVSDEQQCRRLIDAAVDKYGRLETLINNAGVSMDAAFEEMDDLSHFARILGVNLLGAVYCTRYALPYLKQTGGRVVAVSSLAGATGVPRHSAYSASKHAMNGFFESLRIELSPSGVSVTIAMPDYVSSGIHERNVDSKGRTIGKDHGIDYDRIMTTETCARLILRAAGARKRQAILSWRGKLGRWIKLVAPGAIDRIALKAAGNRKP